ncbi:MAG: NfeD family protein [Gemmatimonadota bacterium]|jgi:membrane-bound serine protease (ClpP class)
MSGRHILSSAIGLMAGMALLPGGILCQGTGTVVEIPIRGDIELGLAPFVERSLEHARATGASAAILDIETPGGRVDAAQRIVNAIGDAGIPVYAFINRHAYSAGAMIALAADRIYMREGSVMGAATPVVGSGEKAPEKIVSAMRSQMRALAEVRGLDPAVAEAMVDEDIAIEDVVEAGKLLTLTTSEAVALGYALEVADWEALMADLGLEGTPVESMQVNWAERIVRFLSNPIVAPFLLSLGFLGLIAEIKSPGLGIAGFAGLLALSLFFGSHLILGLAGMEDLLLFGAGAVLIAVEVFVIPGFGLFGVLGGVGVLAGLYMSMIGGLPTVPDFAQAGAILSTSILIILISSWALLRHLPRSSRLARSGVFLLAKGEREDGWASASPRPDLVGREGEALTDLRPAGTVLIGEERVDAVSESSWIEEGTGVKVVTSEGYRLVVRPLRDAVVDQNRE